MILGISDWSYLLDIPSDGNLSDSRYLGQSFATALGDFDRDGKLDLFLNHHRMGPTTLNLDFAGGSPEVVAFELVSDEHGATFFDIDQDGDLDVLDTSGGKNGQAIDPNDPKTWNRVFLQEEGALDTTDVGGELGLHFGPSRTRMLVPVNFDGEIALFNGSLPKSDGTWPSTFFRMLADGTFEPWTPPGFDIDFMVAGIGAHLGADDHLDFVAHGGFGTLQIYECAAGQYDETVIDTGEGQFTDLAVADFDGDLRPEIFVGRNNTPNRLYAQSANGTWREVGATRGLADLAVGTNSATVGDFDNDGDLDIAALHTSQTLGITFWINDGVGRFTPEIYEDEEVLGKGQNIISGDFDNNGVLDLLVSTGTGAVDDRKSAGEYVYLHVAGSGNHWLNISLEGIRSETSGLGARVYVTTEDGETRTQEQDSGVHYWRQDSPRLHFGLGEHTSANVTVVWADGFAQKVGTVTADQHLTITEARGTAVHNDFDGDGTSDLLWIGQNGDVRMWRIEDFAPKEAGAVASVAAGWRIAATEDVNGDARQDLVWRGPEGRVAVWEMEGNSVLAAGSVGQMGKGWRIAETGDFGGDGRTDLLLRGPDDRLAVWELDGIDAARSHVLKGASAAWVVAGAGDFDGDGRDDILWRTATGRTALWEGERGGGFAGKALPLWGPKWAVAALGDFDGNGSDDILWRHEGGALAGWLMERGVLVESAHLGRSGASSFVVGSGDFDGDGSDGVLWRGGDGRVSVWEMDGLEVARTHDLGLVGEHWEIIA